MSFITVTSEPFKIAGKPTNELTKGIAHVLYNGVMANFEAEGRPNKWTPLKPKTRKQRIRQGFGEVPILNRKRALSLRTRILETSNEIEAVVGTPVGIPYDTIHQFGGEITRHPYSSTVRLRTNKKGELIRQEKNKNLAVFGKKKHKLVKQVKYSVNKAFTIKIIARPYLVMTAEMEEEIIKVVKEYYESDLKE